MTGQVGDQRGPDAGDAGCGGQFANLGEGDLKLDDAAAPRIACGSLRGRARAPPGDAGQQQMPIVGTDDISPLPGEHGRDDLAGLSGVDHAPAGQVGRVLIETEEGSQLHPYLRHRPCPR
ncbi:hypothetical protein [Microbispora sp. GKU 823]|uniref:hypothetical protein n=1 Tax=Microbispora sp. GKU 823 TaxID=1652100 RepID=UPI0009A3657C|nr:hypothetical protein [Microbispora sp. GKU 823]OPG07216.1 hypothetical protein B1L11_30935 [Microbispora sp. GKU 823]